MTLSSYFRDLGKVPLPCTSNGRQVYMQEIDASDPKLPDSLSDYLDFVKTTLKAVGVTAGKVFMTVDEKVVPAGGSQRRPKPHVDGCFYPDIGRWGHGGGGGWNHFCNGVPVDRMPVIVASSTGGTALWEGEFDVEPKNDGDLSHVSKELNDPCAEAAPDHAYALSPDCIHESPVMEEVTARTFVRLALPVNSF